MLWHLLALNSAFSLIWHAIFEGLQKLDFGKLALTYQGILWGIWSSIPMFHTCKKTYPSILWAHQIWAWYLKPCQKKVGCQNYRGLPDTLYFNIMRLLLKLGMASHAEQFKRHITKNDNCCRIPYKRGKKYRDCQSVLLILIGTVVTRERKLHHE